MDDLKYQVDLLTALNDKIMNSERIYRQIAEHSGAVYLYFDFRNPNTRVDFIGNWDSLVGERISNHPYDESYMLNLICESDQDLCRKKILDMERDKVEESVIEVYSRTRKYCFRISAKVKYDSGNYPLEKLVTFVDITKIKVKNDELTYLAYYDSLTGIYNRNKFVVSLHDMCEKAEAEKVSVEVMFIDIDGFKKINDTIGLLFGDELVQVFASYLKEIESDDVCVGRFGSDMFVVGIFNPCGQKTADSFYRQLRDKLRNPIQLSNKTNIVITVSCGVAEFPDAGRNALDVIKNAEIVLFRAKEKGRNNIQFFDPDILTKFIYDVSVEKQLSSAVDNEEFVIYFQPQFRADTGKLRGAEALIRWPDRKGGFVSRPADFIPIAEKNGTIVSIGEWVLKECMRIMNDFRHKYHYPLTISINISAVQLRKDNFIDIIQNLILIYDVNPENLEFEITESVFIEDFDDVIAKINILRKMGIKIALDDFGTGYSSLSYLKRISIDTLKIDKSFVDTMIVDDTTDIITDCVITMSRKLGFETVAEGVETKEQLLYLQKAKCDIIQGYLLGKPMPRQDFEKLIIRHLPQ